MFELFRTKFGVFFILFLVALAIAALGDYYDTRFSYHDILVEFHGLVFDLLVLGIIVVGYEVIKEKKVEQHRIEKHRQDLISKYKDEIDDFRFWHSEESYFRLRGIVVRLASICNEPINLSHTCLENDHQITEVKNMDKWNFAAAKLKGAGFLLTSMKGTRFYRANLVSASFINVNLTEANFQNAILVDTTFEDCILDNIDLKGAYVSDPNWFQNIRFQNNSGIEKLEENFKLVFYSNEVKDLYNVDFYTFKKVSN